MLLSEPSCLVRKLRLKAPRFRDGTRAILDAQRLLASTEITSGLNPDSILCIRHFPDPLPGALDLNSTLASADVDWLAAAQEQTSDFARTAMRPSAGSSSNANAVLFENPAEMLACLLRSWAGGRFRTEWWWQTLFPGVESWVPIWREYPQEIPAAVRMLEISGNLPLLVESTSAREAISLLDVLASTFGLDGMRSALNGPPQERRMTSPARNGSGNQERTASSFKQTNTILEKLSSTLLGLKNNNAAAPEEVIAFVSVAVLLRSAPALVREPDFFPSLREWITRPRDAVLERPVGNDRSRDEPAGPGPKLILSSVSDTSISQRDISLQAVSLQTFDEVDAASTESTSQAREQDNRAEEEGKFPRPNREAMPDPAVPCSTGFEFSEIVSTGLGGVFYLLNAALRLGLYRDFTLARREELALSPWDYLSFIARAVVTPTSAKDPIWALLARLAGRNLNDPIDKAFVPPADWRIPKDWLSPFDAEVEVLWHWTAGWLTCRHPADFELLVCPCAEDAVPQILGSLSKSFQFVSSKDLSEQGATPLERWVSRHVRYLGARLRLALGSESCAAAWRLLLNNPAQVAVSGASITVRFALATHPLPVRMAGLDRDPGWIPAAGYRIAFRYD